MFSRFASTASRRFLSVNRNFSTSTPIFSSSTLRRATTASTLVASSAFSSSSSSSSSSSFHLLRLATATFATATVTAAYYAHQSGPLLADAPLVTADIPKVKKAIEELLETDENMGPTLVRLAWHASGTYDKASGTGGSDGSTMRFPAEANWGANAGLHTARNFLEPIHQKFPNFSIADLWTLAGAVAIEYMGGPKISWRPGRKDAPDESSVPPDGRLPDAEKPNHPTKPGSIGGTIQHIRDIFYRMGFNDQEIVALSGAHALGRCHTTASGYSGPWTRAPTTFSNAYYTELLENKWTVKKWDGPLQFEDPTGDLMMLPSDMALIWDKDFRSYVEIYAKDEEAFFRDFSKAWTKLTELGVKAFAAEAPKKKLFGLF